MGEERGGTEVATKTVREEEVGTAQDEQQEARWGGGVQEGKKGNDRAEMWGMKRGR